MTLDHDVFKCLAAMQRHPGQWQQWPIAYPNRTAAQRDMDVVLRGGYTRLTADECVRLRWTPAHRTFLDGDGKFRIKVMFA